MRLSENLNNILNKQVTHELRNANIYLQIASYFENFQLNNIAKYFYEQSNQEKEHADKFVKYINSRTGGNVVIQNVEIPNLNIGDSITNVGNIYITTEEETTEAIEKIMELVLNEKSFIDLEFIQTMLKEQMEEEDTANKFAFNLNMVRDVVLYDKTF